MHRIRRISRWTRALSHRSAALAAGTGGLAALWPAGAAAQDATGPTLVALMAATTKAPEAMPRIPGNAPQKPWRRAFDRVSSTPGPGLRTVRVANNRNNP